jgi:hypothetical protein
MYFLAIVGAKLEAFLKNNICEVSLNSPNSNPAARDSLGKREYS